jgi:hypothetical protein
MVGNYKLVCNTATGRRRYMQYLVPFVVANDIVDRYDIWINTTNKQDIEFFKILSEKFPKINLVYKPDGIVNRIRSISAFYRQCIEDGTIYFKLDDDIIWMKPDMIAKMVRFRIDNPNYFIVSPLVINNALCTYIMQNAGTSNRTLQAAMYKVEEHLSQKKLSLRQNIAKCKVKALKSYPLQQIKSILPSKKEEKYIL